MSKGLASPVDMSCAVCVEPGTLLAFRNIPSILAKQIGVEAGVDLEVEFIRDDTHESDYRDGLRFSSGLKVSVQKLPQGLRVDVICTPESIAVVGAEVDEVEEVAGEDDGELVAANEGLMYGALVAATVRSTSAALRTR